MSGMSGARTEPPPGDFDVIAVREVSRHFGRRRALTRVSLECRAGQTIGLLGPNGAGKSTLLGVLATVIGPTSGTVLYGGHSSAAWGDGLRRRIGMLGHDLFLYSDLTARENLEFFGRLYGLSDVDVRVGSALERARLADRAHDRVAGFSRGLRQRLALERALLHAPRLVLLDEPFTGLDDASAALLIERLGMLRGAGAIVIMATHDFESAEGVVDTPVCLREGRLITIAKDGGTLRERYRRAVAGESEQ
jgi:ABC-type multidrug transport system ATPase subunit